MLSNNTVLIRSLTTLAGVVVFAIVALAIWGPKENSIAAGAIQTIVTVITLIAGILVTLKVSNDAKIAAVDGKVVSQANNAAIAEVHTIVNSQRSDMQAQIKALSATLLELQKTLAYERGTKPDE